MSEVTAGTIVGGKYRLDRPIGQGGMASVWQATHETLGSTVAVKMMDAFGSKRKRLRKRFMREAQLAANLKHRNVVNILDYGVMDSDGQPFMVMELLEGQSLADRIESTEHALTDLELVEITIQLLSGIAAAHDADIVHRDVKPENVFLVRDADGDYPKLLDFGISRNLEESDDARMTATGMVVGTPLYMSPEQARGLKDIDQRSDLWSVGMILYEAFTGAAPFESENMGDIMIQVATTDVPPLGDLRPDLPDNLVHAVMRALERDRLLRWANAREFRAALIEGADQLAAGQTVVPRPGRRPISSQIRVGTHSSDATPWEDADTAIDPATLDQALKEALPAPVVGGTTERVRAAKTRNPLWYAIGGGLVVVVLLVGGLFAVNAMKSSPGPEQPMAANPPDTLGDSSATERDIEETRSEESNPATPSTATSSAATSTEAGPDPEVDEPTPELADPTPQVDEPAPEVAQAAPEVDEPDPDATEPAPGEDEQADEVASAEPSEEPATEPTSTRRRRRSGGRAGRGNGASGNTESGSNGSSGRRGGYLTIDY